MTAILAEVDTGIILNRAAAQEVAVERGRGGDAWNGSEPDRVCQRLLYWRVGSSSCRGLDQGGSAYAIYLAIGSVGVATVGCGNVGQDIPGLIIGSSAMF